jgi:hypothetical protein
MPGRSKAERTVRKLLKDLAIDASSVGILWLALIRWAKFRTPMEGLSMQWPKTAGVPFVVSGRQLREFNNL